MRRGEVWWVSFAGNLASNARKPQLAVIVSNDDANEHSNHIQVVPLSGQSDRSFRCQARVTVEGKESKAMADQIMTVSKYRLTERLGLLSPHDMLCVDTAIRMQLGLTA
jgi:mRNA interferase MazF